MLASDLAQALDPVRLAERAGLRPDPWQRDLLRSSAQRLILCCARQVGKSTVTGLLAAHTLLYQPGSLVLLVSPSLRQSGELYQRTASLLHAAGAGTTVESAERLVLANGSRLVSLPGSEATIRGYAAVALVCIDEAARCEDSLYHAMTPMLATSGGRLALLSSPFTTRGFFADAWSHGEGWERVRVKASDCPRIPAAFIAEARRNMGAWWAAQELDAAFMEPANAVFRLADLRRMIHPEVEEWAV